VNRTKFVAAGQHTEFIKIGKFYYCNFGIIPTLKFKYKNIL